MKKLYVLTAFLLILFTYGCDDLLGVKDPGKIVLSRFEITGDNNNNSKANPGETIKIAVYLKNVGEEDVKGVKIIEFKSLTDFLTTSIDHSLNNEFGDINAGQDKTDKGYTNYTFIVNINISTIIDSIYNILLNVQDTDGNKWTDTLKLLIEKTRAKIILSKYEIAGDNNNNSKANPGEELEVAIYLKNIGIDKANEVIITEFRSLSDYLTTSVDHSLNNQFGDILAGQEKTDQGYTNYTFLVNINKSTIIDSVYNILINIQDNEGNIWTDSLKLLIEKTGAIIILSKFEIAGDNNNNGKANPGEELQITVYLKNIGIDKANEVVITEFKSLSDYLTTSVDHSLNDEFGDILAGQEKTDLGYTNYTFKANLSANTPIGEKIEIRLTIEDAEGNTWQDILEIIVE